MTDRFGDVLVSSLGLCRFSLFGFLLPGSGAAHGARPAVGPQFVLELDECHHCPDDYPKSAGQEKCPYAVPVVDKVNSRRIEQAGDEHRRWYQIRLQRLNEFSLVFFVHNRSNRFSGRTPHMVALLEMQKIYICATKRHLLLVEPWR